MNNTLKVNNRGAACLLFTDLDGTLLDHHNYSFKPAIPLLNQLKKLNIPVICNTSKTFAELLPLRQQLKNDAPFITENGAGVYLPMEFIKESTIKTLGNACLQQGYWRFGLSQSRAHWQTLLQQSAQKFQGMFTSFQSMGDRGIAHTTGLSLADARLANQREFSEPLLWLGDAGSKQAFIHHMHQLGANVHEGGRFLHVVGDSDKGVALRWLHKVYALRSDEDFCTLAAGDGANDVPMLKAADYALIVRSPVNPLPSIGEHDNLLVSSRSGPAGWADGISKILMSLDIPINPR